MYSLAPNEWKNQIENGVFTETNGDFILGQNPTALMGSAPPLPLSAGGVQRPPARPGVMRPGRPSRRASSPQTVCPPPPPPLSWSSSTSGLQPVEVKAESEFTHLHTCVYLVPWYLLLFPQNDTTFSLFPVYLHCSCKLVELLFSATTFPTKTMLRGVHVVKTVVNNINR